MFYVNFPQVYIIYKLLSNSEVLQLNEGRKGLGEISRSDKFDGMNAILLTLISLFYGLLSTIRFEKPSFIAYFNSFELKYLLM